MSSIGTNSNTPSTRSNEYGFEIENTSNPEIEFSDSFWKKMSELQAYGVFRDGDLSRDVEEKLYQLGDDINDDVATIYGRIQEDGVTEDEYWAGYHLLADMLGIQQRRFTVLDENESAWDEKFTSVEQAEQWAAGRDSATYIYDTWKRKYRKIGGKNWRS